MGRFGGQKSDSKRRKDLLDSTVPVQVVGLAAGGPSSSRCTPNTEEASPHVPQGSLADESSPGVETSILNSTVQAFGGFSPESTKKVKMMTASMVAAHRIIRTRDLAEEHFRGDQRREAVGGSATHRGHGPYSIDSTVPHAFTPLQAASTSTDTAHTSTGTGTGAA